MCATKRIRKNWLKPVTELPSIQLLSSRGLDPVFVLQNKPKPARRSHFVFGFGKLEKQGRLRLFVLADGVIGSTSCSNYHVLFGTRFIPTSVGTPSIKIKMKKPSFQRYAIRYLCCAIFHFKPRLWRASVFLTSQTLDLGFNWGNRTNY